jgi:radical SAM superfamily enzyme YgiQ (UPF0313 family)
MHFIKESSLKNNTKPLKIYLGDLTYDTVTISAESIPLNIGFVAAYCKKQFGENVELTLFKYIGDLEKAINENPPDILALSNYVWNRNLSYEMFSMMSEIDSDTLLVWGGPNFPIDLPSQRKFMKKYSKIDVYVPVDGETGFANTVERALRSRSHSEIRSTVLSEPIDGCVTRGENDEIKYTIPIIRIKTLDEIPSPYTTGLLDKFFDGKLTPMMQTNRGCPFHCTFCADGKDEVNRVTSFGLERVIDELNYITNHKHEKTHNMIFSDLNFGMYPRDREISKHLAKLQTEHNYPDFIYISTGKNQKEKIIESIKTLKDSMPLWMSVQSLDQNVLKNIRRDNISTDQMLALQPAIKDAGLQTRAEVILGLPGETHENHMKTLRDLVNARMDEIQVHTCMMLDGSEMGTPAERKKWDLHTKFRVLQRDFAKLSNGKTVLEFEEVSVSSPQMSFEEYVDMRILAFVTYVTNRGTVYDPIIKFLREQNLDVFDYFCKIKDDIQNAPQTIQNIFQRFKDSTINELWDSPEEIIENYQKDSEYQKLLDGKEGINVMYNYLAEVTAESMDDWAGYILEIAYDFINASEKKDIAWKAKFQDVSNFCRGTAHNTLGKDRMQTNPSFEFKYDVMKWLEETHDTNLDIFLLKYPYRISFELTEKQFKSVQDTLNAYGDTMVGKSKALRMISSTNLWRHPVIKKTEKNYSQIENPGSIDSVWYDHD